jgi:hypothetical protein
MQLASGSVTLASPLIFLRWGSHDNNSPGAFRENLVEIFKLGYLQEYFTVCSRVADDVFLEVSLVYLTLIC